MLGHSLAAAMVSIVGNKVYITFILDFQQCAGGALRQNSHCGIVVAVDMFRLLIAQHLITFT